MEYKFKKSNAEVKSIKGIQFGVISPEFIKNISVTQSMEFGGKEIGKGINQDMCYDPVTGQPNLGAINDPRMGSTYDPEHAGYFGHIELVRPVYHIGFLKIVLDILRCVSYYTSELLVPREDYENKKGRRNLKEITHISKGIKKCPITQKKLPTYTKEGTKIAVDFGKGKEIINPTEVYSILEKISDEDAYILGMNPKITRPEWLLLNTIPVPPPHVRPSVFMSSSQKCDDDLTTKLNEIVKTNIALANAIEKSSQDQGATNEHFISQLESLLQYNVSTFIDNQHPGQPPSLQRSGKPLKTLRERLAGKDGRVRGNLMGKRVDYSARTVITADPNLSIDQVGVPKAIAMNLTVPETVTDYNKDKLLEIVKRGPNNHPGAKFIIKNGGSKIDLKFANITDLKNGWVVERHLNDGDAVLFNRQPSLHKMSIMGHKVKVLEGSTFRLNLAVTSPYNADFDGDEMNLHVPQSLTARAEVELLMMVDRLIVSPQANKPVIGIIQDSLLSSCKMTKRNVLIKKHQLMNMFMLIDGWDHTIPKPAIIKFDKNGKATEYWTGKQIFSFIVPKSINIDNLRDYMNPYDQGILIKSGQILSGSVDKSVIGKSQGGLIHILFNDLGSGSTKVFLNQVQKVSNYWIKHHGFTMGIGDAIASTETMQNVHEILESTKEKIRMAIDEGIEGNKDSRVVEEFINSELNSAVSEAGKKAEESLNFSNNFKAAVSSGSKGSNINISQIMAAVGQQNVEGRRINYSFKHRTLPHFEKFDIGQESRGFVENSYLKGLTPTETFFHAMAGREGLIDTACKSVTWDTEILIMRNGETNCVKIGEWIDEYMDSRLDKVERRPWAQDTEVIDFLETEEFYMPTADKHGVSSWGRITHITRHDPGELVYLVKTQGGREVKVVESKSLLVWNPDTKTFDQKLTSQIKLGEFVPVTISLPPPPVIHTHVSMEKYFPKTEYMYGTEFNKAKRMMENSMKVGLIGNKAGKKAKEDFNRTRIPRGWWEENNGISFTTPYNKKASLQRATVRSAPLEDGCVYPYSANRDNGAKFPDTFELNNEFGIFIGLFLAEGYARMKEGTVDIANNDPVIRDFVKNWFTKLGMKFTEISEERIGCNGNIWTSSTIRGYSTLLAKFLHLSLGHKSEGKYVPDFAFNAPEEFIKGILNGYFSGDGSVNGNGVNVGSASEKLITGISFLCSRLGIFGTVARRQLDHNMQGSKNILPSYNYSIRGQWSKIFAEKVHIIEANKQEKLNHIKEFGKVKRHINYDYQNDVVLDPIVSIEKLDIKDYPKVYDVTIPSTDNFSCFNGQVCKQTSETGYIQRRLVKALEDVSVKYDHTVRNSRGNIIQFLYGEDGLDATYMENIHIKLLGYDFNTLREIYENPEVPQEFEFIRKLQIELTEFARTRELNNAKYDDDYYPMSVNISRVLKFARSLEKKDGDVYFTSLEIFQEVLSLCERISDAFIPTKDIIEGSEKFRSYNASRIFRIYIHSELASMKIKDLTKNQILYTIEEIEFKFKKAIAHAGEMCGVLAAQSIGEPATQMSALGATRIIVLKPDGNIFKGPISKLIDPMCKSSNEMISEVVDIAGYKIIGIDSHTEKTSWNEISQISRHPANGNLVKVRTKSGKVTTATLSHSFLKRSENGIIPVLGSNLKLGDRIPVAKFIPVVSNPLNEFDGFKLTKDFGWFIGSYLADGNINYNEITISKIIPEFSDKVIEFAKSIDCKARYQEKKQRYNTFGKEGKTIFIDKNLALFLKKHFGEGSEYKYVGAFVYASNLEFISGIVGGYFDGDGNVNCIPGKQMIRSMSLSEQLTIDMITLLSYFGIFASKCIEKNKYSTIQISRKYARIFKEKIGLVVINKSEALDKIIEYIERPNKISQEMIDKIPEVGDLLATVGKKLKLPVQIYGRYVNKESIGRTTLIKYIEEFEKNPKVFEVKEELEQLKIAAYSDAVWDEITSLEILDDPKEYVYDFTVPGNQSFMVDCNILVHNTLNSVEYNTNLVIDWTGQERPPVRPNEKIGVFIDALIEKYSEKCQLQPDGHTIYLPLEKGTAKAMSTDEDGNIMWTEVEAVTRHPPINKDGSNTLVKIITESGREAIATKAKSFLVYKDGKIIDKEGSDLKVGDLIPIVGKSTAQEFRTHIDLKTILDPKEVVFTDYMIQAKNIMLIANKTGSKTEWFHLIKDKVPYNRSDTLRVAIERAMLANGEIVEVNSIRAISGTDKAKLMFVPGKIYPKSWGKFADKKVNGIPSDIKLDREFGFLIGAYLAEGCVTDFQVCIANNNENYRKMATAWSDNQDISNRLNISNCGGPELNNGKEVTSTSICIHSTILRNLLVEICGKGSYEKRVPDFSYSAPDCFVEGLLDAYICGDGSIDKRCGRMTVSSRSKTLRDGISLLLTKFNIITKLSEFMLINKKDKTDPNGVEKPVYLLSTYANDAYKLSKFISAIDYKIKDLINNIKKKTVFECICGKSVSTKKSLERHKENYCKIRNILNDTLFDPILSIEEYISEHPFVYDLTVEKTRNMTIVNGIHQKDTFHLIARWEKYPAKKQFLEKQLNSIRVRC